MPDWNPNSTATKGLEWAPHTAQANAIASSSAAMVARQMSLAAELVGAVEVYLPTVPTGGQFEMEVISSGAEIPTDTTTTTVLPNEDVTDGNVTGVDNNTAGTLYTNLVSDGDDEYLRGDGTVASPYFEGRMTVGVGNYSGKRILAVTLRWTAYNIGTGAKSDSGSGLNINGTLYSTSTADVTTAGNLPMLTDYSPDNIFNVDSPTAHYATWYRNPATNEPWTIEEIERFDTTDEFRLALSMSSAATTAGFLYCAMEITHCTENRVARGAATVSSVGWQTILVQTPLRLPWLKANATRYTYVLRRLGSTGSVTWRSLYGAASPPISQDCYSGATLNAYGLVTSLGTQQTTWLAPVVTKGPNYVDLGGGANSYISAPDTAALSIASDLTLIALVSLDDWTPAATSTILAKWNTTGNQRAYALQVTTGGNLRLILSTAGSAAITKDSTAALASTAGIADGAASYVAATFDANNGAGGYDVRFWYSTDGITWTQLGSTVTTATPITLFDSTALLEIGAHDGGTLERLAGNVYYAEVRNAISASGAIQTLPAGTSTTGFPSVKARVSTFLQTASPWSDAYSNTYTVQAGATQVGQSTTSDLGDSQPYATLEAAEVYSGRKAEQEFSNAASTNYSVIQTLVRYTGTPTDSLAVKIKRRSDNVQLGGVCTITTAAVDAITPVGSDGWAPILDQLASVAGLSTATQYYIEFSSATDSANPWIVAAVNSESNAETRTFGGTTDLATYDGAEVNDQELVVTLSTPPATPSNFAAAVSWQDLTGDGFGCAVDRIARISLSWTATALGVTFARYEVQRTENGGVTWSDIARVDTEATTSFVDYEGKRGVAAQYRIRVLRLDGAFSAWSTLSAGVTPPVEDVEWLFVSNEAPTLNVAFNREPQITYEFLDADEVEFLSIYGRDKQVALKPTEDRGVAFDLPLIVSVYTTPTSIGMPVFAALRAIAENDDLTYVCVLDPHGNRWLAQVQVPEGRHLEPLQRYHSTVRVTEISDTFTTPPDG